MKPILRFLLLFLLGISLLVQVNAQTKPAKTKPKTQTSKQEDPPPPSPPEEAPPSIEMLSAGPRNNMGFDTSAVPEDELTAAIRSYLAETKAMETGANLIEEMYNSEDLKQLLPEDFRTKFVAAYRKGGIAYTYMERITIRTYRKHFTLQDMNDLLAFYKTPIGKKMSLVMPVITIESALEGGKLGKWVATQL